MYWHKMFDDLGHSFIFPYEVDICGFEGNVLTAIGWIVMKFGTQIHIPQEMNCNNFDNDLVFHLAPSSVNIDFLFHL